ncbi:MAG: ABC transporter ATP-binding protein [Ardenticatenaceae bacterium]|nr:ABC transporter ATP-binding protein [Ardenticatenaceae bacterium]MCB8948790.1 ABC transporter ATP-binding protein [Ardenticatenaceae bacterium]
MILQVEGVGKRFGGLQALADVTFDLPEGQILGLIGPNGAGKTTLFNCISGVYEPSDGRVTFRGEDVTGSKPYLMAHRGMARTHQIVRPLNELTVRENVIVGACFGRENHRLPTAGDIADEVLEFVRLADRSDQLAGSLNVGQKKRLEMARALAARPYLLLLDEVLAGLNPSEIVMMVEIVKRIRTERNVTIIMIEHVMHAIMNVSDRLQVLDYGRQIAEGTPEEVANDEKVIEAYLGDPKLAERLMTE